MGFPRAASASSRLSSLSSGSDSRNSSRGSAVCRAQSIRSTERGVSVGRARSMRSFECQSYLHPVGETFNEIPPKAIGAQMELRLFFMYVLIRAFHPVIIEESKTMDPVAERMVFPYQSGSVCIVSSVSMCMFFLFFCWAKGGTEDFMNIFDREPLIVFSMNGAVYALGDFLEMNSLGDLPAATYAILQQFRIIVLALMLIPVKGQHQTRMQWIILFILMFGMSTYIAISSAGDSSSSSGSSSSTLIGLVFALAKVIVSCLGAVITDKYTKKFRYDPTHVCIARLFISWSITLLILSVIPRQVGLMQGKEVVDIWSVGVFHGWDAMTIAVTVSFFIKSVSTLYIVALLDSILKTLGESFAVLVIYGYNILAPWVDKVFDPASFMSVLVVVAACFAYIDSKALVEKASNYDATQALAAMSA